MMSRFHFLSNKLLCSLLLGLFLSGCAAVPTFKAYEGEKEIEELAIIKNEVRTREGFLFDKHMYTFVSYVGNQPTRGLFTRIPDKVLVEPGRHYLQVNYTDGDWRAFSKLWLDAERGKTYKVRSMVKEFRISFWIEDEETGKPVGGIPGGEPENQQEN
jgi:hypothetical protein